MDCAWALAVKSLNGLFNSTLSYQTSSLTRHMFYISLYFWATTTH